MRFFQTILSGAALIAAAAALTIDTFPANVVAGETYTVTYSPKDNTPTTFILRQGPSGNLNTIETLTTTATGGSFSWTVKSTYANQPNYALEIRQGDVINYSGQFPLTGGSGSAASSAASSSRASASSAAASSASAALSSAISSTHASASIVPSSGANSTVASATLSQSRTAAASGTSRPTSSTTSGPPQSTGAASSLSSSPLAAIFGAFAAFAYLA